jgi:hypothetical protein
MRFYQGFLPAVCWDGKNNRALFEFENGLLETEDEDLITELLRQGYMTDDDLLQYQRTGTADFGGFKERENPSELQLPSGKPPIEDYSNLHQPITAPQRKQPAGVRRNPTVVGPSTAGNPANYAETEEVALSRETAGSRVVRPREKSGVGSARMVANREVSKDAKKRAITRRSSSSETVKPKTTTIKSIKKTAVKKKSS